MHTMDRTSQDFTRFSNQLTYIAHKNRAKDLYCEFHLKPPRALLTVRTNNQHILWHQVQNKLFFSYIVLNHLFQWRIGISSALAVMSMHGDLYVEFWRGKVFRHCATLHIRLIFPYWRDHVIFEELQLIQWFSKSSCEIPQTLYPCYSLSFQR